MKLCKSTKTFFLVFSLLFFLATTTKAKHPGKEIPVLTKGYYLVVGAFKIQKNAIRYSNFINSKGENSKIGKNPDKDLYYVYVVSTMDFELIKSKWTEYRLENEFANAWVYKCKIDQIQQQAVADESSEDKIFADPTEEAEKQPTSIDIPEPAEETETEGYKYVFNVINSTTLKEASGFITVVDEARNKVLTSVETNTPVIVPDPGTQTKEVLFICDIFGYVKQQVALKLDDPMSSGDPNVSVAEDGTTVVNFELARHKAGDILTMYHVYFYNDAAIMKPESKFELNSLLEMLQENENLKIKIHGHTNGNAPGKIMKLVKGDDNFFEVTSNNVEGYGSAKELSLERANMIKRWLEAEGISPKRMELKGWGGKKMIYDKKSDQASKNVRVEIEILRD